MFLVYQPHTTRNMQDSRPDELWKMRWDAMNKWSELTRRRMPIANAQENNTETRYSQQPRNTTDNGSTLIQTKGFTKKMIEFQVNCIRIGSPHEGVWIPPSKWCQPYDEAAMIQESSEANTSRPIVDAKSGSRCKKNSNPETHVDKKNQRTPQRPIIPFVTTRKREKTWYA
jgi:hypothetical protein